MAWGSLLFRMEKHKDLVGEGKIIVTTYLTVQTHQELSFLEAPIVT